MAEKSDARLVSRTDKNEATSFRDHGGGDPSEAPANNGRPNDLGQRDEQWALPNSTFADRAKKAAKRGAKQVDGGENKAVSSASTKSRRRKSS